MEWPVAAPASTWGEVRPNSWSDHRGSRWNQFADSWWQQRRRGNLRLVEISRSQGWVLGGLAVGSVHRSGSARQRRERELQPSLWWWVRVVRQQECVRHAWRRVLRASAWRRPVGLERR